ncbi:MAG: hypothetical protein JWO69_1272, partial [Thermoleophilia bacterium]|nr:hypothetical protein [Thermoleophilia bacterium]
MGSSVIRARVLLLAAICVAAFAAAPDALGRAKPAPKPAAKAIPWTVAGLGPKVKQQPRSNAVVYPARLRGAVRIRTSRGGASWKMLGVPNSRATFYRRGVRYVTPKGFEVVSNQGTGTVKEYVVVQRRQGVRTWRWRLSGTGARRPRLVKGGAVRFGPNVVIPAPVLLDKAGRRILPGARWTLRGNVLSLRVNDRKLAVPYVVDPSADYPQRLYPDSTASNRVTGAEKVLPALGVTGNRCTQVAISQVGQILFASLSNPGTLPGGAIASTNPSPGTSGWGLMNTTAAAGTDQLRGVSAATNQDVWMVGNNGRIIRTSDGGCSWTTQASGTGQRLNGVSAPTAAVAWAVGNNGTIRKTTNGGATWTGQASGTGEDLFEVSAASTNVAWAVGKGGDIVRTINGGATWTSQNSTTNQELRSVTAVSATVAWASGRNGIVLRTTNAGATWVRVDFWSNDDFESITAIDANTAWAVGQNARIVRTTDGGASWTSLGPPPGAGGGDRMRAVDFVDANTGWVTGDGGEIWRTTNGGATWVPQTSPTTGAVHGLDARSTTLAFASAASGDGLRFSVGGVGDQGWVAEQPGGTTLPAGPWTVGGRVCRDQNSGGRTFALRARLWKVRLDGAGNIAQSTQLTSTWSPTGGSITLNGLACGNATTTFGAAQVAVRSLTPAEHLYVEYALVVQSSVAAETVSLVVSDAGTYIDFGASGNTNTPPPAPTATTVAPAPTGAYQLIAGNTPTFDITPSTALDSDSYQRVSYQVCSVSTCATTYRTGTSAGNLQYGDANTSWGPVAALADGQYWVRARLEEQSDGVNVQVGVSAWTPTVMFRVDTTGPPAPAPINDGSTAGADATYAIIGGELSANWMAPADVTGVASYQYCFSSTTDCTTPIAGSAGTTAATSITRTGLPLTNGQTYYFCVRAQDGASNWGIWGCSNGQFYDYTPPSPFALQLPTNPVLPFGAPTGGPQSCETVPTFGSATPTLDWADAVDASLAEYRVYFDPSSGFPLAYASVTGAPPTSNLTLAARAAGLYWWKVAARDLPGNMTWNDPGLPTPQVQVGIDAAAPTVAFGVAPADGAWVTTATPTLAFSGGDDRCLARMQVWVDDAAEAGTPAANLTGTASSFTPAALTDGTHQWHVRALDVVGRSTRTAPADRTVRVDTQDPVSTVTWPTGPTGGTAVGFTGTVTDPLKDGAASGIASWRLRWSASATGPWTNMAAASCSGVAAGPFACAWNSTVVPSDGNYFFRIETVDVAGRTWNSTSAATNIDNTAPALTFDSFAPVGGASSGHWWAGAPSATLYYRAAATGSVDVRFNASDFNGVSLAYPNIGGGFAPGGAGVGPTPFRYTYGFTPGVPVTATQGVTATDGAGRTSSATFRVEADDQAPVGASIDYLDGYLGGPVPPSPANSITFNRGIDFGGAGVGPNRSDIESWVIQREEGDLMAGSCNWGATTWLTAPAFTNPPTSPVADPLPAANDKCYQYRIVVTDHV